MRLTLSGLYGGTWDLAEAANPQRRDRMARRMGTRIRRGFHARLRAAAAAVDRTARICGGFHGYRMTSEIA